MVKKLKLDETLKDQYKERHKNRIYSFLLDGGAFRGKIIQGTRIIQEMQANHELAQLETLVLGRAYLGALIMAANLKQEGRIQLHIECGGPIKGFSVEADSHGTVRGYLKENPIPLEKPLESLDLSPLFGPGFMTVSRLEGNMKQPHTSQVMLNYGDIGKDLASYYLESEQIPSLFDLSIKFDDKGQVSSAGALFLQVMPGTDEARVEELEEKALSLPSLGAQLLAGDTPGQYLQNSLAEFKPEILESKTAEFFCPCSKDYYKPYLKGLKAEEKKDIRENGPFPLEICCHNCNTKYQFSQEELQTLLS
ncbi:MAG: Hsp33 family molecular chaperone HslO [Spirochaetales bacterium]|nr:Hsp33 family molecular chaperone HslO [Spirochaetales bacterium]